MKRSFYFIPVWAVMAFAFLSCGEDRTYEFLAKTEVDNWIEAQTISRNTVFCAMNDFGNRYQPKPLFMSSKMRSLGIYELMEVTKDCLVFAGVGRPSVLHGLSYH